MSKSIETKGYEAIINLLESHVKLTTTSVGYAAGKDSKFELISAAKYFKKDLDKARELLDE